MGRWFFLSLSLCSSLAAAKVDVKKTVPMVIPTQQYANVVTSKDVEAVIPLDLQASDNAGYVANKVGDHALQNWLKNSEMSRSSVVRAAARVENAMKTEVALPSSDPQGTQHKFSFQFLALQAVTKLEYKGWLNGAVKHDSREGKTSAEVVEKMWDKDVVLSHTASSHEDVSAVGLRWNW